MFGEKPQAFFKCLTETLATITEALNGVIAILLKDERDRQVINKVFCLFIKIPRRKF